MAYTPQMPQSATMLSPDVYQSAATYQLGQMQDDYRVTVTAKRMIIGIIGLIFGVSIAVNAVESGGASAILWGLVGLACFAGGVYYLVYAIIYKDWHVFVFEQGFLHKKGSEAAQPFRWDQIESVWYQVTRHYRNGIYMGTTHRYKVRRQGGYEIVINDRFSKVGQLGDTISNQVTRAHLPRAFAAYNAGQTVNFGSLSVSQQGIMNGSGSLLTWPEISDVDMKRGYISVSKAGRWLRWSSVRVANIPNAFVFVAMVRSILKK